MAGARLGPWHVMRLTCAGAFRHGAIAGKIICPSLHFVVAIVFEPRYVLITPNGNAFGLPVLAKTHKGPLARTIRSYLS